MWRIDRRSSAAGSAWKAASAFGLIGAAAVGVALWYCGTPPASGARERPVADAVLPALAAGSTDAALTSQEKSRLPASLDGSQPPPLPTDGRGHLGRARAVRDFFDYFLTTQNEIPAASIDALVRRHIAAQLDGTAAADEAIEVWSRYTGYRSALDQLTAISTGTERTDLNALRLALDQRDTLGARWLGDWSEVFFGAQSQQQHVDLARLRIASDHSLTDAERSARLATLDAALPSAQRAARERRQQAAIDTIAQASKERASTDAVRAQITQTLGPEAAGRFVTMQEKDNVWQAKYTDYANQRAQIERENVPQAQRDAQIAQLRQQVFTNASEAMRAASLDRGSGS